MADKKSYLGDWWPSISNMEEAQMIRNYGLIATLITAFFRTLFVIVDLFESVSPNRFSVAEGVFSAIIYLFFAWGIYKMSRLAAVLCLTFFSLERIPSILEGSDYTTPFATVAFIWLFIQSLRAVFAYHRFAKVLK